MKKRKNRHIVHKKDMKSPLSQKTGLPSGSLIHIGKPVDQPISIYEMTYIDQDIRFRENVSVEDCFPLKSSSAITWIDVAGVFDREVINGIGRALSLHPLSMEDIMNTQQRTKMEEYENYLFFSLKTADVVQEMEDINYSQLSMIVGDQYIITFQENRKNDLFVPIRSRIELEKTRLEKMGNDYLLYLIFDMLVDRFFDITDFIEDNIDEFDEMVIDEKQLNLQDMYKLKRSIIQMRKCVVPLRDVVARLLRSDSIEQDTMKEIYFSDVHDHVLRLSENLEVYREIMNSLHETYLSSISNRMNAVMKVLTVISTIFIPLTFIVGVYGMNFPNMPEFKNPHAYYYVWGVMIVLVFMMLGIFRRNKWL
ncbi:MAG TPA: magnesium/cobalt transporter CorA [Candidatus Cloacimonadota bacterium]|nr:magnesium/cobalt transporter CorA [Candidatus Cloacimonadota bacterium]HPT71342.1 magnesium/cobalt transporter CorA [Candidatus Cloacimonadota bacterium]